MVGIYNLEFISDDDVYEHVKNTVSKYRFNISLKEFNANLVDPIKLTFDSKVYGKTLEEVIEAECIRQIDKSNTNHIGYFHQNLFKYFDGWSIPSKGFDVINEERKIYVEMKNKHNTMNSASSQKTYMKMQDKILRNDEAVCYLVEIISKDSQDRPWLISLDGESISHKNIRKMSIDNFYALVTGFENAFEQLCSILPKIIEDVVLEVNENGINNTVFDELKSISPDIISSLYLLAFEKYQGFEKLKK